MFKINYAFGPAKKSYSTLKGAKIACAAWFRKSSDQWLDVVEIQNIMINGVKHHQMEHANFVENLQHFII